MKDIKNIKTIYAKLSAWIFVGIICGVMCGGTCVLFAWLTTEIDTLFHANSKLMFLMPLMGIIVVYLYDDYRESDDLSVNALYRNMRENKPISIWMAPLAALSTCLAYLTGGSVGRIGPALQIGGSLAIMITIRLRRKYSKYIDRELLFSCGISAGFSGILNSPIAAAIFGVEVLLLLGRRKVYIIPTLITSFLTWKISELINIDHVDFHGHIVAPELNADTLIRVAIVCFAAMLAGRFFCYARQIIEKWFGYIENKYLRVFIGTGLVITLTSLLGNTCYNGIGFTYISDVLEGHCDMLAFMWKLILTACTLGCGLRGGEIAPTIFIGATGCFTVGSLIGLDPGLSAAIGIVGALTSVTNCPIAIFVYGLESICFNTEMAICFAMASIIAHLFSGLGGLYSEQHPEQQLLKPKW